MGEKKHVVWIIFLLVVAFISLSYMIKLIVDFLKRLSKDKWTNIKAVVTNVIVSDPTEFMVKFTNIKYSYVVGGARYSGTYIQTNNSTTYKVKSIIDVKVNPKNPNQSYAVEESQKLYDVVGSVTFIIFTLIFMSCLYGLYVSYKD